MYQARYFKADGSPGSEVSVARVSFRRRGQRGGPTSGDQSLSGQSAPRHGLGKEPRAGGRREPKALATEGYGSRSAGDHSSRTVGGAVVSRSLPQPHSWNQKVPRKLKALARRSALNDRAEAGRVVVIESLQAESPKTRWLTSLLASMETEGKVLVLTNGVNQNVHLSGRNLPDVHVLPFGTESPYDVIWSGTVVIEEPALESVSESTDSGRGNRRRPVDADAIAAAEEEQAERKAARKQGRHSRRVKGEDIDTSAPLVGAVAPAEKPKVESKPKKAEAQQPVEAAVEAAAEPRA